MSIYDVIAAKVKAGELFYVPATPGGRMVRQLIATKKIYKEIFLGPWTGDPDWKTRCHGLQSELTWFVDGYPINVAFPNDKKPFESKPQVETRLLHPGEEEVWEFRGTLKPPVRIFGRFAARDTFIALRMDRRKNLPRPPWTKEIRKCQRGWNSLLAPHKPVSGKLYDYLSNAVVI